MKTLFIALTFLFATPQEENIPEKTISCNVTNISFNEFTDIIYNQTHVKVLFDETKVKEIRVTLNCENTGILNAIKTVLKGSGLNASYWNGKIVIIPGDFLIAKLPIYRESAKNGKDTINNSQNNNSNSLYTTGRKANINEFYQIGNKSLSNKKTTYKILGKIIDNETGESITGATIYNKELQKGTTSDNNGFFMFSLYPNTYNISIECLGYEKRNVELDVLSSGDLQIELKKSSLFIDEVLVHGDLQHNIKSKEVGMERLSPKTIKEIPVMMGEKDILKVSSLLPGIISIGEGASGFNVRGGSADQNAFYINKIPIYNTSHLFGFFPAFNSEIIKDFSIYKGYLPSQFGGKLSSIFNIATRQGNKKFFTANGGINPISGYATVEGPIIKDTLTILINARTSYSDWVLSRIKDTTISNSSTSFNDLSFSLNYDLKKTQTSIFVYNSNDNFNTEKVNSYQYSNTGAAINFRYFPSTNLKIETAIVGSQYKFTTTDEQETNSGYKHSYKIEHYEFKTDFNHNLFNKLFLDYGVNSILYKLDRGVVSPYGLGSLRKPLDLGNEIATENSVYLTNSFNPLTWMKLSLGVRYSIFTPLGARKVYKYANNQPTELDYITDTLVYGRNKAIKWYNSPEIRAAVNIETDNNGSIKLSFSQMQQNLFMLNNTMSISPNTQWKLADYNIKPSKSNQLSFGVFRNFPNKGIEASVECYYKSTSNFPEFKDGAMFLDNPNVETTILQGDQKAYGVEVFIKRSNRKLNGWISYTYSRSIVQVNGKHSWDKINDGNPYPANYDVPNSLNALINYNFTRRFSFSTVVSYQTGRPITYPESVYYINGVPYYDYSKRNKYNIPDYFRIDASFKIEGNLKKKKLVHSSVMFNIYNVTGRDNPFSVYFKTVNGNIKSYKYSIIGVPIFTITWLFKLGNYASE